MSGTEKGGSGTTKTPADFLKSIRGRPVVVKLNSGVDYRGFSLHLLLFFVFPTLDTQVKIVCQMLIKVRDCQCRHVLVYFLSCFYIGYVWVCVLVQVRCLMIL
ncbi:hypothetical protein VIGAN_04087300 [Vigna angularis var. angularis]|uniref:LSM domain-containing protein n=1 Tax=Vigna angularis var. angularis TaxID=157739 RepID=A0A0S3RT94_PHAAN|nr:hypothetical protein VIGAN_04087300 [Vigna angularis var. angularis]